MSIKNLYPKARPQTIYNVINGRPELPAASTFSRASEATYVDANGIIRTAGVDEPRFNYDVETGEFLGLFLESAIQNRMAGTGISTQGWAPVNRTVTTGQGLAPNGKNEAVLIAGEGAGVYFNSGMSGALPANTRFRYSCFYKLDTSPCFLRIGTEASGAPYKYTRVDLVNQTLVSTQHENCVLTKFPNGWLKVAFDTPSQNPGVSSITNYYYKEDGETYFPDWYMWGPMVTQTPDYDPAFIECNGTSVTKAADAFSLTSSSNFDGGFSLLLDSDTTTDDYFYKIKASGTTIAELNNANGTLDWVINGVSAATNGEYPQVGAIQPGRVRTISSFGAADGTTQQNYLYTTGLSFPTNAIVASGADEVEFGTEQTLKALYLWNGQLSNTEAVSVIKGEYNIVSNEPIKADSYSFVYNTDPTTVGETTITLPYIVPTVSMRVYWGDGTNSAYEQGVTPSHTYPYPGQYRIQIEADDGFDAVRLGDVTNIVTRVDQWAPQFRVGASGTGFTGEGIKLLLRYQGTLEVIPPFKYTDLTDTSSAFEGCKKVIGDTVDWVPINLQEVQKMGKMFYNCWQSTSDSSALANFPTLQTSGDLVTVTYLFTNTGIRSFVNDTPLTNTSSVTSFSNAFRGCRLTNIILDTSNATDLRNAFEGNLFVSFPGLITNNVENFTSTWKDCSSLTSFPQINTSSGTNFSSAFNGCTGLTSFPLLDTSSCTNFSNAWENCNNLTSFPLINTSSLNNIGYAWYNCDSLDNIANAGETFSFPLLDFSQVTYASRAFYGCKSFTSLPVFDFSSMTNFGYAYFNCDSLTSIPATDFPVCTNFNYTFRGCSSITAFPSIDMHAGTTFVSSWQYDALLADFPANMFDTTGTLVSNAFEEAWKYCALTAQSIENILVSLDTNGQSNIELGIDGGTNAAKSTWTAAANTAYTNLINKGWTITSNP